MDEQTRGLSRRSLLADHVKGFCIQLSKWNFNTVITGKFPI